MREIIVAFVLATLAGCSTVPPPVNVSPTSTAAPTVQSGDNATILTAIRQVQTTLSTVTTNYALDEVRAGLERAHQKDIRNANAGMSVVLIGLGLLFLAIPAPKLGAWTGVIITIAVSMIAGGALIPVLWPF